MKKVILSMDIEDWYHLDYFKKNDCDKSYSFLDGIDVYLEILKYYNVKSEFFVVGEIANKLSKVLKKISDLGHSIGSHGWNHKRPIMIPLNSFKEDIIKTKHTIEDLIGKSVNGYRAPCFSIDRKRLDIIQEVGYLYDSSRIDFDSHPLYKTIDLHDYQAIMKNVYRKEDFFEFQATTSTFFKRKIPISGGGYIRILPWMLTKKLINDYLRKQEIFVFYIHPFELSHKPNPSFPHSTKWYNKFRFKIGRREVRNRIEMLIKLLKSNDYDFITFSNFRDQLILNNNV